MPLGAIKPRALSAEEKRWLARWETLEFPKDIPRLYLMSRREYFAFMYALDPRLALLMSTEPGYREVLAYQRDKSLIQEIRCAVLRGVAYVFGE
jgi:hypothetical protein